MKDVDEKLSLLPDYETGSAEELPNSSLTPPPKFEKEFASLSFHSGGRIRLLDFPLEIQDLLTGAVTSTWPRGFYEPRTYAGAHELFLKGQPAWGNLWSEAAAYRLLQSIFKTAFDASWVLCFSTNTGSSSRQQVTSVFRRQLIQPEPCDWMSIGFVGSDRIWFVDAPSNLQDAMYEELRLLVQASGPPSGTKDVWQIKIHGCPWMAGGVETMKSRLLVLKMTSVLEQFGFTVYTTIEHTWICRRPQGWTPGVPVYQV